MIYIIYYNITTAGRSTGFGTRTVTAYGTYLRHINMLYAVLDNINININIILQETHYHYNTVQYNTVGGGGGSVNRYKQGTLK